MISNTTGQGSQDIFALRQSYKKLKEDVIKLEQWDNSYETTGPINPDGTPIVPDALHSKYIETESLRVNNDAVINQMTLLSDLTIQGILKTNNLTIFDRDLGVVPTINSIYFPFAMLKPGTDYNGPGLAFVTLTHPTNDTKIAKATCLVTANEIFVVYTDEPRYFNSFQMNRLLDTTDNVMTNFATFSFSSQACIDQPRVTASVIKLTPMGVGNMPLVDWPNVTTIVPKSTAPVNSNAGCTAGNMYFENASLNNLESAENAYIKSLQVDHLWGIKDIDYSDEPRINYLGLGRHYIAKLGELHCDGYFAIGPINQLTPPIRGYIFTTGLNTLSLMLEQPSLPSDNGIPNYVTGVSIRQGYDNNAGSALTNFLCIDIGTNAIGFQLWSHFINVEEGNFTNITELPNQENNVANFSIDRYNFYRIQPFVMYSQDIENLQVTNQITLKPGASLVMDNGSGYMNLHDVTIERTTLNDVTTINRYATQDTDGTNKKYVDEAIHAYVSNKIYLGEFAKESDAYNPNWTPPTPELTNGAYYDVVDMDVTFPSIPPTAGFVKWLESATSDPVKYKWQALPNSDFAVDNISVDLIPGASIPTVEVKPLFINDYMKSTNGYRPINATASGMNIGGHGDVTVTYGPFNSALELTNAWSGINPNLMIYCPYDNSIKMKKDDGTYFEVRSNFHSYSDEYDLTPFLDGVTQTFDLPVLMASASSSEVSVYYGGQRLVLNKNYTLALGQAQPTLTTLFVDKNGDPIGLNSDNGRSLIVNHGYIRNLEVVTWGSLVGSPDDSIAFNDYVSGNLVQLKNFVNSGNYEDTLIHHLELDNGTSKYDSNIVYSQVKLNQDGTSNQISGYIPLVSDTQTIAINTDASGIHFENDADASQILMDKNISGVYLSGYIDDIETSISGSISGLYNNVILNNTTSPQYMSGNLVMVQGTSIQGTDGTSLWNYITVS